MSGAIIATLSGDEEFSTATNGRIAGRSPSDASSLFVTVRTLTDTAINARAGGWRMVTRITAWIPPATSDSDEDPFLTVWRLASMAAIAFGRLENKQQTYQNAFYGIKILQGPTEEVDDSRGPAAPMYGCSIQLELTVKVESP